MFCMIANTQSISDIDMDYATQPVQAFLTFTLAYFQSYPILLPSFKKDVTLEDKELHSTLPVTFILGCVLHSAKRFSSHKCKSMEQ